jgi:acyl-CoA thioesterase-2
MNTAEPAPSASFDLYDMVEVVPAPERSDAFVGDPVPGPYGRIFGGQLIGQAVMAATPTIENVSERVAHSLHAYFVRAGDSSCPVEYDVETIRDGRSFSVRSVRAHQKGRVLLTATMSFHRADSGLEHQSGLAGRYPAPEDLPEEDHGNEAPRPDDAGPGHRTSVELRRVPRTLDPEASAWRAGQALWLRARGAPTESPARRAVHSAALAMATDFTILESIIFGHGFTLSTPGLSVASLDHSIWWHAPANLDEWLLYVQESPWAGGERGLVFGRLYNRGGKLVASVTQEGMVRVPANEMAAKAQDAK